MALALLPDMVKVGIDFLLSVPEVTALVSTRVLHTRPRDPTDPQVVVGLDDQDATIPVYLTTAQLTVDCWGRDLAEAMTVGRTVQAAMFSQLPGTTVAGAFVSDVQQVVGLRELHDRLTSKPRTSMVVALIAHPA